MMKTNDFRKQSLGKHCLLFPLVLMFLMIMVGCEETNTQEINYEPFEYQVSEMEVQYRHETIMETETLDDRVQSSIIEDINEYMDGIEMMRYVEEGESGFGSQWHLLFLTEEDEELIISEAYYKIYGEWRVVGVVRLDGTAMGYLDEDTFIGMLDTFDAWLYIGES